MKILIACEQSGVVREAFIQKGHDAISCDLMDSDIHGPHYKGDVRDILNDNWDLIIAHPPCTFLAVSGARWLYDSRYPNRKRDQDEALEFVKLLMSAKADKIAIENPIGCISSRIRKPDQIIKPYQFGEDATKSTCLWLKNLSRLKPTNIIVPSIHISKSGRSYDSWWFKSSLIRDPEERRKFRSKTFTGVACAMADQWG